MPCYNKHEPTRSKRTCPTLDDKCALTLLRSSFVPIFLGELRAGSRKPIHVRNVRRATIHDFGVASYAKRKLSSPSGVCQSTRIIPPGSEGNDDHYDNSSNSIDHSNGVTLGFDLSSRNNWRYIIEDIMFVSIGDFVTIIVDVNDGNANYWGNISE